MMKFWRQLTGGRSGQSGTSMVGTMVAVGIIGIGTASAATSYQNYLFSRNKTRALKMIRDARATFVPAITEATKMFLAKGCKRQSSLSSSGGFRDEFDLAKEKFGDSRYAWMSLGDLTTGTDYSDLIGIDRPQTFTAEIDPDIDNADDMINAVNRCNRYSGLPRPVDSTAAICFEFGARTEDAFTGQSILSANAGLVEVRLEFADIVSSKPMECRYVSSNGKAAFSVKLLMHWVVGQAVVSHEEIFHVTH